MSWLIITDIIVGTAILTFSVFVIMGLYQLIKRKSIKKIDRPILGLMVPAILLGITYIIFEKFIILNTRPNGSGEPSFPSTHTMITATIFFCVAILLPYYIKSKTAQIVLDFLMLAMIIIICFGRVIANMHWVSDVIGALVFSALFALVYYLTIRKNSNA